VSVLELNNTVNKSMIKTVLGSEYSDGVLFTDVPVIERKGK